MVQRMQHAMLFPICVASTMLYLAGPVGNGLCPLEQLSTANVQHEFQYGPSLGRAFEPFTNNAIKKDTVSACASGSFVVGVEQIKFDVQCAGDGVPFSHSKCHEFCKLCNDTSWSDTCSPAGVIDPIFGMPWASPTNTNYAACLGNPAMCTSIDVYSQFLGPACITTYPGTGVIKVAATFKVQCCSVTRK